jgi:LemA protein
MTGVLALAVVVATLATAYSISYNRLVLARQQVADAWAVIDAELERRHQLIPGLVAAVTATAAHERVVLQRLIDADRRARDAGRTAAERSTPEDDLAAATHAVVALRERYPSLNSQQNFLQLQRELATTEDRLGTARRFHNIKVAELNRRIEAVPSNFVAARHGFTHATYFGAAEEPGV